MPLDQSSTETTQPSTVPPPAAPAAPVGARIGTELVGFDAKPMTKAEVDAIRQRRSFLSDQLGSVQGRRDALVRDLRKSPDGVARQGIEERIRLLDQRTLQLEQDIDIASKAIANSPLAIASSLAEREKALPPGTLSSGQITAISIVGTLSIGMPLALAAARVMLKRASVPKPTPQILESAARLERMEQAIDAVAVEVERISEGQRFVTQLMAGKPAEQPLLVPRQADAP
jgi:orotate phosphoribosyltransferase-like protein